MTLYELCVESTSFLLNWWSILCSNETPKSFEKVLLTLLEPFQKSTRSKWAIHNIEINQSFHKKGVPKRERGRYKSIKRKHTLFLIELYIIYPELWKVINCSWSVCQVSLRSPGSPAEVSMMAPGTLATISSYSLPAISTLLLSLKK